jgi:SSS family solute:Na+ symporter
MPTDGGAAFALAPIDFAVILLDFAVVLAVGLWISRRTNSGEELFLAGRRLGFAPIGLSLFASNISSTTLIGLAGAAYATGISVANYEWMSTVVLVFFALVVVPPYIKSRVSTMPEFLARRFDRRACLYFSALTILSTIVVDTAGSLYAGALVLQLFVPQLEIWQTCAILALIAGIYTAAGGLAAVVYNDVIQAIVLLIGSCCLTFTVFGELDFSWARATQNTPDAMLSMIQPLSDATLPWLGTLTGVPILGFYFWCTNQFIVQRVLAARSVEHARWGALLGGLLKLPVLFIMVLPGTMARALFPQLDKADLVFPTMVTQLLPPGLVGLVMAGLIAAILSSLDSTLNSASTLVTLDFIKPRFPQMSPRQTARVGRIVMVLFMVLAVIWAPMIAYFPGLFQYLQEALSYLVPPVVAVFILGLFWRRTSADAALVTLVCGHLLSGVVFLLKLRGLWSVHFTITAGILFAACCLICALTSLATASPSASQLELLARRSSPPAMDSATSQGWRDHRVLSAGLLALTAVLVLVYW